MSNILFIIPNYFTQITGANKRAKNLSRCLSQNNKIFILTSNMTIRLKNGKVLYKKKNTFFSIISLFLNQKFDYWFCDNIKWSFIPFKGLVFTLHDMKEWTEYGRVGILKKILLFIIVRKAKYLITVSEDQKKIIKKYLKVNSYVFFNAISKIWLEYRLKNKNTIKKVDNEYIIYISNFAANKGHLNLLKNNPLLNRFKIVLVGSHIDKSSLLIKKNLLKYKNVKIYNDLPESKLLQLIANSSFAVFPSNYEGFGMPILETIAVKKKILISKSLRLKHFNNCSLVRKVDFKKGITKNDLKWTNSPVKQPIKYPSCFAGWEDVCVKIKKLLKIN